MAEEAQSGLVPSLRLTECLYLPLAFCTKILGKHLHRLFHLYHFEREVGSAGTTTWSSLDLGVNSMSINPLTAARIYESIWKHYPFEKILF